MNSAAPMAAELKPVHIMIVDDVPAHVLLLERMLADAGYVTTSVSSGSLALEAARRNTPDLILLDIAMPGMGGYEVCGQLKQDPVLRNVPVMFVSALHETVDKVIAYSEGGVDYVTKPFLLEDVLARITAQLRGAGGVNDGGSVYGIAGTRGQAETMAAQLKLAEFTSNDISVLFSDKGTTREFADEAGTKVPNPRELGAGVGTAIGGVVGGGLGWLVGFSAMAIPGVGPFFAAGPLMTALGGAMVGAALNGTRVGAAEGGIAPALMALGIPEARANGYEGRVKGGEILISVHSMNAGDISLANDIFTKAGAEDICTIGPISTCQT